MTRFVGRALFLAFASACVGLLFVNDGYSQKKGKAAPSGPGDDLLKPQPRPARPDLPPSELPLKFIAGERIAFVGNSTAERMNLFGHFETLLQSRFPELKLVVRNFGRPADEVGDRQRSADYTKLDDPLYAFGADTFLCFFGFNESFAGEAGVKKFEADYEKFFKEFTNKYPRDDAKHAPRFVLVSPMAFEASGDPLLPDATATNARLKLYADAVKRVAAKQKLAFIDLFTPTEPAFSDKPGLQYSINGAHLNEAGDKLVGIALDTALFGGINPAKIGTSDFEKLRAAVNDKSWVHSQDYRMVNGWYVYGGRRTFDTETFPREYLKLRNMVAVRDQYIWDMLAGKPVPAKPDDSKTGDLYTPETRFGAPGRQYSENPILDYQTPENFIKSATVADGFEIQLFADERKFPEIAKPVQLNFDNKGRLWVSCMPSYPQWKPGDPKPNDKLVILEDTDGDGKADKSTVFYDQLHCPTGFEFYNGGVIVTDQPRLIFLKDTDGDDKADEVVQLLDGWATDDTHHTCGAFEWSNAGKLHMLEGIATSTTLETPWGPHRSAGSGGAYVYDPRTMTINQFKLPGMANMWCYQFDQWGQGFPGDGTTPNQAWDTPLSGAPYSGRAGMNFLFEGKGERPNLGSERLISRQFPDAVQGQFTYACVITMNGFPRFTLNDDGAGFKGKRIMTANKQPDDLISSKDKHFRPADPQIGPDGAMWFGDWANALIGHMQYSQRDPNRDHERGRIYRLVAKGRPLVKPVTQFGKGVPEILEQFREYEWRTRYRARRELFGRPDAEVLPAVNAWVAALKPTDPDFDRLRTEALYIQISHHAIDVELLKSVLKAKTPEARAAATHILADERDRIPDALTLLRTQATDEHPRVRLETLRGLSFFPTMDSVSAMLEVAKLPMDYWTKYTLDVSLGATQPAWRNAYTAGIIAKDNPIGWRAMVDVVNGAKKGGEAEPFIKLLLSQDSKPLEVRNKAMTALSQLKGNPSNGRTVFVRNCTACHRTGAGEGQDYGPNMDKVGTRLTRYKLIESLIDPNADVEAKYLSTKIETADGKTITGLLISEDKKQTVIFDGKEKRTILAEDIERKTQLKQSSMPEGQAGAMAPVEFLDLVEYLSTLK